MCGTFIIEHSKCDFHIDYCAQWVVQLKGWFPITTDTFHDKWSRDRNQRSKRVNKLLNVSKTKGGRDRDETQQLYLILSDFIFLTPSACGSHGYKANQWHQEINHQANLLNMERKQLHSWFESTMTADRGGGSLEGDLLPRQPQVIIPIPSLPFPCPLQPITLAKCIQTILALWRELHSELPSRP